MTTKASTIIREQIISTLQQALYSLPAVRAVWLGGSEATGSTDRYSDVDCQAIVEDDAVEHVFEVVAAALSTLSPIDQQYRIPEPAWHGHSQVFYRLQDAPPWLLVDMAVLKLSSPADNRFLESERHGDPRILFDRDGLIKPAPFERASHQAAMKARLPHLAARFELFRIFVDKAAWRQDAPDAISTYHAMSLRPLIELLRMRYCPDRYDFGMRYLQRDLPADVYQQVEPLFFCGDLAELQQKHKMVAELFETTLGELRESGMMD